MSNSSASPPLTEVQPSSEEAPASSDLRNRILKAATRFFAERGYSATSMRELAEVCCCTKPALYYYFKNKEALFQEVIETASRPVWSALEQSATSGGSVQERILRGITAYFDLVQRNPEGLGVLIRAELRAEPGQPVVDFRTSRAQIIALTRELLKEGVKGGEIREDVNLDDAVLALTATVEHKCWLWLLDKTPIEPDFADRAVNLFFHGVAP